MKNNKLLYILLIIFSLVNINITASEEIIFETPEIEASNNGNILKANRGGKAIINKEFEIIGKKFLHYIQLDQFQNLYKVILRINHNFHFQK